MSQDHDATQVPDVKPEQTEGGDNQTINVKVRSYMPIYLSLISESMRGGRTPCAEESPFFRSLLGRLGYGGRGILQDQAHHKAVQAPGRVRE
jgi:hypothetical protein